MVNPPEELCQLCGLKNAKVHNFPRPVQNQTASEHQRHAREVQCRGNSSIRHRAPPSDPLKTGGIGLRQDPKGVQFLVSEVPL